MLREFSNVLLRGLDLQVIVFITLLLDVMCKETTFRYTRSAQKMADDQPPSLDCCHRYRTKRSAQVDSSIDLFDKHLTYKFWESFPCPPPWNDASLMNEVSWEQIGQYGIDVKIRIAKRCNIDIPEGALLATNAVVGTWPCRRSCKLAIVSVCCVLIVCGVAVVVFIIYKRQPDAASDTGSPTHQTALSNHSAPKLYSNGAEFVPQPIKVKKRRCSRSMPKDLNENSPFGQLSCNHYAHEDTMRGTQSSAGSLSPCEDFPTRTTIVSPPPVMHSDKFLHISPSRSSYDKLSEDDTASPCSSDPPIYEYIDDREYMYKEQNSHIRTYRPRPPALPARTQRPFMGTRAVISDYQMPAAYENTRQFLVHGNPRSLSQLNFCCDTNEYLPPRVERFHIDESEVYFHTLQERNGKSCRSQPRSKNRYLKRPRTHSSHSETESNETTTSSLNHYYPA